MVGAGTTLAAPSRMPEHTTSDVRRATTEPIDLASCVIEDLSRNATGARRALGTTPPAPAAPDDDAWLDRLEL